MALVAVANQVGIHTWIGQILAYIAPLVSVLFGAAVFWVKEWSDWRNERAVIKRSRRTLEEQANDPKLDEEHKAEARRLLKEADLLVANAEVKRIKSVVEKRL